MVVASRSLWAVAIALLSVLWAAPSWAAIKTEISARRVGVGQPVVVQITMTQDEDQPTPSNPQLKVSGGAQVLGPSISTQSMVRMHNFSFSSEKSVVARFQVIAQKEGTITIGPGSFQVGGRRVTGEAVEVEVVAEAQAAPQQRRRRSMFGNDPTDPFGNDPFDDFFSRRNRQIQVPVAPPEYQVERAPDPIAFLQMRLSRSQVVVGEPVVLTVLAYGSQGDFGEIAPSEPALPDFLSYRAMDNIQSEPPYQLEIEGATYIVRKIREYIIVPLKTGTLSVGGLATVLQNNRRDYPQKGHAQGYAVRAAGPSLQVGEPPAAGRPAGYLVGDVGTYTLTTELSSRQGMQGEFGELIVRITGEGQIPSQVRLPEQNGIVWEAPTMSGGPEVQDGVLQGTRVLKYAFQFNQAGAIDLGELSLPYFDHRSRKYAIARAALGQVEVAPAAAPAAPSSAPGQPHDPAAADAIQGSPAQDSSLPMNPRAQALPTPPLPRALFPAWAWWAMVLGPLGTWLGGQGVQAGRALAQRRKATVRSDPKQDLKAAADAMRRGESQRALQLSERVLFDALERGTGVKARGVMRSDTARVLAQAGLDQARATEVQECLEQLEASRYGSGASDATALLERVRAVIARLPQAGSRRES